MKLLNKNKIIVSALALAIGASLAGSVSGTVAWYQYSTRANASFIGQSGGFSGNLQMRFASEASNPDAWRTRITWQEMNTELAANQFASEVVPMTFGGIGKDAALAGLTGRIQPVYLKSNQNDWVAASSKNYAQFELQLRYVDRDGVAEGQPAVDSKDVAKDVYISKLVIQQDQSNAANSKDDLSDAVRVHVSSSYNDGQADQTINRLISNNGGTIATSGKLDLDGDTLPDKKYADGDEFGFGANATLEDVTYGSGSQTSYANSEDFVPATYWSQEEIDAATSESDPGYGKQAGDPKSEAIYPAVTGNDSNKLTKLTYDDDGDDSTPEVDKLIGKTMASGGYLTVTVTIWVEGWQELNGSAIWDTTKYINSKFNVGIQFAVQDAYAE